MMNATNKPFSVIAPSQKPVAVSTKEELLSHVRSLFSSSTSTNRPGFLKRAPSVVWIDIQASSLETCQEVWGALASALVELGVFPSFLTKDKALTAELMEPMELDALELVGGSSSNACVRGAVSFLPSSVTAWGRRCGGVDENDDASRNRKLDKKAAEDDGLPPWCSFIATRQVVITIHRQAFPGYTEMQYLLSSNGLEAGVGHTATALIATLINCTSESRTTDPTGLLSEVDCMDEMVLLIAPGNQDQPDLLRRLAMLRRQISADRHCLYLKEKLLQSFLSPSVLDTLLPAGCEASPMIQETQETLLKITQVTDRLDDARDTLNQANLNFVTGVSMRMSQSSANMDFQMQILSQVATICLPLNLVASIYGMNCTVPFQADKYDSLVPFFSVLGLMAVWCVICSIPTIRSVVKGNQPKAIVPVDY